jgi:hypothetical protein
MHARWDLEPRIAQNRANEFVREHFRPMRSQRDRGLSLRLLKAGINLCGSFGVVVRERRKAGVENVWGNSADSHDRLLGFRLRDPRQKIMSPTQRLRNEEGAPAWGAPSCCDRRQRVPPLACAFW